MLGLLRQTRFKLRCTQSQKIKKIIEAKVGLTPLTAKTLTLFLNYQRWVFGAAFF